MQTIVFQSFRDHNIPPWIERCLHSVQHWAKMKGFDYHLFDDSMFDLVPEWYRKKINNEIHLVCDLARMLQAQSYLKTSYLHVIWVDADVLVFSPNSFQLPINKNFSFSKEVYVGFDKKNQLKAYHKVNNAVTLMSRGNTFLPFYIEAMQEIVKNSKECSWTAVGTNFLSLMNKQFPIDHINNVGLFSPIVMKDIANGGGQALDLFLSHFASPIYAANLCLTFYGSKSTGVNMNDELYEKVIQNLLQDNGSWLTNITLKNGL